MWLGGLDDGLVAKTAWERWLGGLDILKGKMVPGGFEGRSWGMSRRHGSTSACAYAASTRNMTQDQLGPLHMLGYTHVGGGQCWEDPRGRAKTGYIQLQQLWEFIFVEVHFQWVLNGAGSSFRS
ncbi:hypothetical protein VNO77_20139 [Canavalia gladiata]|uniref:Uncharacterized protein n=1 Tax=Canavalia gladiata TaxID=3824 RepID=A0AAN9QQ99_CANGL